MAVAPPPTLVFGVSLEKLMEKQKEKYPELEIPRILPTLVDAIFKLDGEKSLKFSSKLQVPRMKEYSECLLTQPN